MSTKTAVKEASEFPAERLPDCVTERITEAVSTREFAGGSLAGLAVAGVGLAHFVSPQLFDSITRQAFPRDTRQHIYINGGIETAIGLGLAVREDAQAGRCRSARLRRLLGRQRRP